MFWKWRFSVDEYQGFKSKHLLRGLTDGLLIAMFLGLLAMPISAIGLFAYQNSSFSSVASNTKSQDDILSQQPVIEPASPSVAVLGAQSDPLLTDLTLEEQKLVEAYIEYLKLSRPRGGSVLDLQNIPSN